jgi:hypothetical protein
MNVCRTFVGKKEGKRPLRRPRRRWENKIKIDLRERGWGDLNWIHLAQDRNQCRALVNRVMNLHVPLNTGIFISSLATGGFS